jgi:hypothetical protein
MTPITIAMNRITTLLVRTFLASAFGGLQKKYRQFASTPLPPGGPYETHATPKTIFMPLNSLGRSQLWRDGHTKVTRSDLLHAGTTDPVPTDILGDLTL